ncbi:TPA: hypothetical protein ACK4XA_000289 [Neisseria gonorrhoeae]
MPDNLILISVLAKPSPTHARKTLIGGYHIAAFQTDLDGRIDRMRADLPSLTMVKLGKPLPRKGGIRIGFDIALSVGGKYFGLPPEHRNNRLSICKQPKSYRLFRHSQKQMPSETRIVRLQTAFFVQAVAASSPNTSRHNFLTLP